MPTHMRQRAEAVELRLKEEVGMIERLGDAKEPHRSERHGTGTGSILPEHLERRRPCAPAPARTRVVQPADDHGVSLFDPPLGFDRWC